MRKGVILFVLFAFISILLSGCSGSALGKMHNGKPFIWQSGQPNQNQQKNHEHEYEHEDNGKHKGEYKNKHKKEHGDDD